MNEKINKEVNLNVNFGLATVILGTEIILYKIIAKILDRKEKENENQ